MMIDPDTLPWALTRTSFDTEPYTLVFSYELALCVGPSTRATTRSGRHSTTGTGRLVIRSGMTRGRSWRRMGAWE